MASKKKNPFPRLPPVEDWPSPEELLSGPISDEMFDMAERQGELTVDDDDRYQSYMQTFVRPFPIAIYAGPESSDRRLSDFKLIRDPANRWVLNVIWKNSEPYLQYYAHRRGLVRATMVTADLSFADLHGMLRRMEFDRRVNAAAATGVDFLRDENARLAAELDKGRSSIAAVCQEGEKRYNMRAKRLLDAGVTFGLVEEIGDQDDDIVRGTVRLHETMIRLEAAAIFAVCRAMLEGGDE